MMPSSFVLHEGTQREKHRNQRIQPQKYHCRCRRRARSRGKREEDRCVRFFLHLSSINTSLSSSDSGILQSPRGPLAGRSRVFPGRLPFCLGNNAHSEKVLSCSFIFFHVLSFSFMFFHFLSCFFHVSFIFFHFLSCSFMFFHVLSCSFIFFHFLSFSFSFLLVLLFSWVLKILFLPRLHQSCCEKNHFFWAVSGEEGGGGTPLGPFVSRLFFMFFHFRFLFQFLSMLFLLFMCFPFLHFLFL